MYVYQYFEQISVKELYRNNFFLRLQEELYQQKERWEKQIVDISRSQVSKDVELQRLKENEEKLKSELLQRKQDIERYMFSHKEVKDNNFLFFIDQHFTVCDIETYLLYDILG